MPNIHHNQHQPWSSKRFHDKFWLNDADDQTADETNMHMSAACVGHAKPFARQFSMHIWLGSQTLQSSPLEATRFFVLAESLCYDPYKQRKQVAAVHLPL